MQGRAGIKTAGERDADLLAGGETLKYVTHVVGELGIGESVDW
jgi:hypothetical protein